MDRHEPVPVRDLGSVLQSLKRSIGGLELKLEFGEIKTPEQLERLLSSLNAGIEEAEIMGAAKSEVGEQFTEWKDETLPGVRETFYRQWVEAARSDVERFTKKGPGQYESGDARGWITKLRDRIKQVREADANVDTVEIESAIPQLETDAYRAAVERNLDAFEELTMSGSDETFQRDHLSYWDVLSRSITFLKDQDEQNVDVANYENRFKKLREQSDERLKGG